MKYILLVLSSLLSCRSFAQKTLVFSDQVYEPQIKTVQLYPDLGGLADYLSAAAAPLGTPSLVIEFDDLQNARSNYYAKVIHCDYNWVKSYLQDLDYMNEYNEYPINDISYSTGTQLPYVHYRFQLPAVKLPGNYLLIVYRNDVSDLVLSKRFIVYSNQVTLNRDTQQAGTGALNFSVQPLNFTIDYGELDIPSPTESIHVVIRQNQRWDNCKIDVKPSFVRDADRQLEFHSYDNENSFAGGNEFRFVDFKSLNYPGQNTGKLDRKTKPVQLSVQPDLSRGGESYAQVKDLDGNYQVDNTDTGEPKTNANYVNVSFSLTTDAVPSPVYIVGAFNGWNRTPDNLMSYDAGKGAYVGTLLLKQGLYNYQYLVDSKTLPENYFEGNHFETENVYEILVYNRDFQRNIDLVVGYFIVPLNPR
jgi:hypothetical protein